MGTEISLGSKSIFTEENESLSPSILFVKQGDFPTIKYWFILLKGELCYWSLVQRGDSFYNNILEWIPMYLELATVMILTTSQLGAYSGGSHELSIALKSLLCSKEKDF